MSLDDLTKIIIKSLIKDPDSVSIKQFDTEEEIIIEVVVSEDDMSLVIGKEGKIANSIRTIVQASSYLKDNKRVRVNINSI